MALKSFYTPYMQNNSANSREIVELERRNMIPLTRPREIQYANANLYAGNFFGPNVLNPSNLAHCVPLGHTFYEQRLHSPVEGRDVQYNNSFMPLEELRERTNRSFGENEFACNLNYFANKISEGQGMNFSGPNIELVKKLMLADTAANSKMKYDFEQSFKQYLTQLQRDDINNIKLRLQNSNSNPTALETTHELTAAAIAELQYYRQKFLATAGQPLAPNFFKNQNNYSRRKNRISQENGVENTPDKPVVVHKKNASVPKNACKKKVKEAKLKIGKAGDDEVKHKYLENKNKADGSKNVKSHNELKKRMNKVRNNYSAPDSNLWNNKTPPKEMPTSNPALDANFEVVKLGINSFTIVPTTKHETVVNNNLQAKDAPSTALSTNFRVVLDKNNDFTVVPDNESNNNGLLQENSAVASENNIQSYTDLWENNKFNKKILDEFFMDLDFLDEIDISLKAHLNTKQENLVNNNFQANEAPKNNATLSTNFRVVQDKRNNFTVVPDKNNESNNSGRFLENFTAASENNIQSYTDLMERTKFENKILEDFFKSLDFLDEIDIKFQKQLNVVDNSKSISCDTNPNLYSNPYIKRMFNLENGNIPDGANKSFNIEDYLAAEEFFCLINS